MDAQNVCEEIKKVNHRDMIPAMLKQIGLNNTQIEIGVWKGDNLWLMHEAGPKRLIGIDLWAEATYPRENGEGLYERVLARFNQTAVTILRGSSVKQSESFAPESVDYVYLDAGHTYDDIISDITAWWPKIRSGGMLAGHDYAIGPAHRNRGVIEAVDEFRESNNHALFHTTKEKNCSWMVLKN